MAVCSTVGPITCSRRRIRCQGKDGPLLFLAGRKRRRSCLSTGGGVSCHVDSAALCRSSLHNLPFSSIFTSSLDRS